METKEAYAFYKKQSRVYLYNTEETKMYFKQMNKERCSFCTKFIQDFDDEMTVEHIQLKREANQQKRILQKSDKACLSDCASEPDARLRRGGGCADAWKGRAG